MDPVVAATLAGAIAGVVTSAIGWVISYNLTLRAQRANTRDQLVNAAWLDATSALTEAQRWLARANRTLSMFPILSNYEKQGRDIDANWQSAVQDLQALTDTIVPTCFGWQGELENSATLFPEMTDCRVQLGHRQRLITSRLADIREALRRSLAAAASDRAKIVESAANLQQAMYDQAALYEDLKIHLQNYSLAKITGTQVPLRKMEDHLPRIVANATGALALVIPPGAPKLE
jgi:hypothetical protein